MSSSHSFSFSSTSFSSSSSSNGRTSSGQRYIQTTSSNPSGTRVQTASQNLGEPVIQETRHYDSDGRQILQDGRVLGQGSSDGETRRIEDVTDQQENQ
ncbi:hypothetical protein N431DRAFT_435144 [Stipitochalara longipes BDJ]|nr:hypothetical protein N431DRAFT_435144 [Stipitochalara longipes BDJ]